MSISVQFGTCSCENEVVDKSGSVTLGTAVSCVMVNTDIINPILKVESDKASSTYCYISDFGRYYFVESCEGTTGAHCFLRCHVDVLYTYKDSIVGLTCLVMRNEDINKWKRDLTDRCIPASNRRVGWSKTFGTHLVASGTSGNEYVFGYI